MSLPVEFSPISGVNAYDNYARIGPGEVENANNLLFERQMCFNRPGLTTNAWTGSAVGTAAFAESVADNGFQYSLLITTANRIFRYGGAEITAASTTAAFGNNIYDNINSVIGLVLFGNNPGGLVTWDPSAGNTYNVVSGAPYRYFTGHKGRAVAGYRLTGGSVQANARTFAWCTPGNVTTWTSTDGTAGEEAIADINDEITGIGVLHDIVVILRRYGIHLAYPTGTLPLPYDVQSFILKGNGCFWPSTAAWSDEMVCMVGEDDVYVFDLQKLTPIGKNIRKGLLAALTAGVVYRGFITRTGIGTEIRYRYNLFPVQSAGSAHYIYDFFEQTWSKQSYTTAANWAFNFAPLQASPAYGITFLDNSDPPQVSYWDNTVNCEETASFTKYSGVLPVPEKDFKINDVLVRTKDFGPMAITILMQATLGDVVSIKSATRTVGGANTGRWTRQWMSRGTSTLEQVGNDFLLTLSVPAGVKFVCDYVGLDVQPDSSGSYRGY